MRRPWLIRKWRLWNLRREMQEMDQGPLGLRAVGRCPVVAPPPPSGKPDPPLLTLGQERLYQPPEARS